MTVTPQKTSIRPFACLAAGRQLIAGDNFFTVMLAGVAVPFLFILPLPGLAAGPAICGLWYIFFRLLRKEEVQLPDILMGFRWFGPSFVAALLVGLLWCALFVPPFTLLVWYLSSLDPVTADSMNPILVAVPLLYAAFFGATWVVSILFLFAFGLIVDRGMGPIEALRTSVQGAFLNLPGLIGLSFLNGIIVPIGWALCYVGIGFTLPLALGATAIAYVRIFGLSEAGPTKARRGPSALDQVLSEAHENEQGPA